MTTLTSPDSRTVDAALDVTRLTQTFGRIDRATVFDGQPETDAAHAIHLTVLAASLAENHNAATGDTLNVDRIAALAAVHDLVETYAGDTDSFRASPAQMAEKAVAEEAAMNRIAQEFATTMPWMVDRITEYERLASREARWTKMVDKLLPIMVQLLDDMNQMAVEGIAGDALEAFYDRQATAIMEYAAEFGSLWDLRRSLIDTALELLRKTEDGTHR